MFPSKTENKERTVTLTTLIQQRARRASQYNKAREENKQHTDQEGRNATVPIWR